MPDDATAGLDVSPMMRRLANDGAGYLFDSKAAAEDVRALLAEVGRLGRRVYAAYEQGHTDACQDGDCVLRPSGDSARICGLSGNYGPFMEPLACGYPRGHGGLHAWASLPTFVNGKPVPQAPANSAASQETTPPEAVNDAH